MPVHESLTPVPSRSRTTKAVPWVLEGDDSGDLMPLLGVPWLSETAKEDRNADVRVPRDPLGISQHGSVSSYLTRFGGLSALECLRRQSSVQVCLLSSSLPAHHPTHCATFVLTKAMIAS